MTYNPHSNETLLSLPGSIIKFGHTDGLSAADVEDDLWGFNTPYNFPSAAGILYVSSNDAANTGNAITIEGLDANYAAITETITTAGLAFVAGSKEFLRVNRAYVSNGVDLVLDVTKIVYISSDNTDAGANGIPDVLTSVHARINGRYKQTLQAVYTVPLNFYAHVNFWHCEIGRELGAGDKDAEVSLMFRELGGIFRVQQHAHVSTSKGYAIGFHPELSYEEKTDLIIRVHSLTANNSAVSGGFHARAERIAGR